MLGLSTNAERIKRYKQRMTEKQFKRLSIWVHPELLALIMAERCSNECYGRTLERLLLGEAHKRQVHIIQSRAI